MTDNRNLHQPEHSALEPELAALDAALGELAAHDAASARPGLEERLALSTLPRPSRDVVYSFASSRRDVRFTALRLAAMVAVAVGGVLVWNAMRPVRQATGPAVASKVEQDLSTWLAMTESPGEWSDLASDSESIDVSAEPAAGAWFLEGESL